MRTVSLTALALSLPLFLQAEAAGKGTSYTPIFGYDDKNGALYGAAAFFYQDGRPGYNYGGYGVTNGSSLNSINLDFEKRGESGLDLILNTHAAQSFDNYYGEGSSTKAEEGKISQMTIQEGNIDFAALKSVGQGWAVGPSATIDARRPTAFDEKGEPFTGTARMDETYGSAGVKAIFDDRDSSMSATSGHRVTMDLRALPKILAAGDAAMDAWQAEAKYCQYQRVPFGIVLAQRVEGGLSYGEPSYSQRYRLGGTDRMRGFQDNRFRGRHFYTVSNELRVPLYKMISAAGSVDVGQAGDEALLSPRKSAQIGFRVGLPPDYGMKARLDMGFGDSGERSLALQFGETF